MKDITNRFFEILLSKYTNELDEVRKFKGELYLQVYDLVTSRSKELYNSDWKHLKEYLDEITSMDFYQLKGLIISRLPQELQDKTLQVYFPLQYYAMDNLVESVIKTIK